MLKMQRRLCAISCYEIKVICVVNDEPRQVAASHATGAQLLHAFSALRMTHNAVIEKVGKGSPKPLPIAVLLRKISTHARVSKPNSQFTTGM